MPTIPVLIEKVANNGYRAKTGAPLDLVAEAATQEEAISLLNQQWQEKKQRGASLMSWPVEPQAFPEPIFSPGDPSVQEWLQIMREERRREDEKVGAKSSAAT